MLWNLILSIQSKKTPINFSLKIPRKIQKNRSKRKEKMKIKFASNWHHEYSPSLHSWFGVLFFRKWWKNNRISEFSCREFCVHFLEIWDLNLIISFCLKIICCQITKSLILMKTNFFSVFFYSTKPEIQVTNHENKIYS